MDYFLGLEVWLRSGEIFLSQREYTVEILNKFGMMGSMSMATPMVTDLEKLSDFTLDPDLVAPTMYRQ